MDNDFKSLCKKKANKDISIEIGEKDLAYLKSVLINNTKLALAEGQDRIANAQQSILFCIAYYLKNEHEYDMNDTYISAKDNDNKQIVNITTKSFNKPHRNLGIQRIVAKLFQKFPNAKTFDNITVSAVMTIDNDNNDNNEENFNHQFYEVY